MWASDRTLATVYADGKTKMTVGGAHYEHSSCGGIRLVEGVRFVPFKMAAGRNLEWDKPNPFY
jgi:hypothetical protein